MGGINSGRGNGSIKIKSQLGATLRFIIGIENDLKIWEHSYDKYVRMNDIKRSGAISTTKKEIDYCHKKIAEMRNEASKLTDDCVDELLEKYRRDNLVNGEISHMTRKKIELDYAN